MAEKDPAARLRRAVKENNLFLVKRLIQRTDIRNPDPGHRRYTSLAWAATLGNEETFEFLLQEGHDDFEYSRDSENNTILMLLADQKTTPGVNGDSMRAVLRMARLYYDRYPKILDWPNIQGKTALHFAAQKGNEELVRMLCDLGADFDLADNNGNTALHYASTWGHITVVQLLIERGCQYLARNNKGFSASDYAYSFSTRDTLQDTARLQVENNKKSRRAIYQQAVSRGSEWTGAPLNLSPTPSKPREIYNPSQRMRSGSGTSRTTNTSEGGELDAYTLAPGAPSQTSMSVSSSPSQPSAQSNSQFSAGQTSPHSQSAGLPPSSALTAFASRVLERDADAMEKYMRRNRSESQGTSSSTDNKSQEQPQATTPVRETISNGIRRLRPSISAQQLRSTESPPVAASPLHNEIRTRSGTNPNYATRPNPHHLTRSSSISNTPRSMRDETGLFEEPESYRGPPSQYAQWPDPPSAEEIVSTPTAGRRMAFYHAKSQFSLDSTATHRRGLSAASLRGP